MEKKDKVIRARIDEKEKDEIIRYCDEHKIKISELIRYLIKKEIGSKKK